MQPIGLVGAAVLLGLSAAPWAIHPSVAATLPPGSGSRLELASVVSPCQGARQAIARGDEAGWLAACRQTLQTNTHFSPRHIQHDCARVLEQCRVSPGFGRTPSGSYTL
jgi:hypothetical protein